MSYNKYDLIEITRETKRIPKRGTLLDVCLDSSDIEPSVICSFLTLDEAQKELSKYKSKVEYMRGFHVGFYYTTAYAIECYEADEDGEFINGSDYWEAEEDWSLWEKEEELEM